MHSRMTCIYFVTAQVSPSRLIDGQGLLERGYYLNQGRFIQLERVE